MSDSIIDRKKSNKNSTLAFILMIAGLLILLSSLIFMGNNLIITIIGALISIVGLSLFKKSN
jgi:CHASE2 domain-containing sensor protein